MRIAGFKPVIAFAVATSLMLITASGAHAFGLTGLQARPTNTQAGAHSQFVTNLQITDSADQLRDLTVSLPPGLAGNPQSVPKCTVAQLNADACPPASQIGTTTNVISVNILVLPVQLVVQGSVYNVQPQPGEPARLGIVLRPDIGQKLIQQVEVSLRPDYGLDTTLRNLPQSAAIGGPISVPIAIDSIGLSLDGSFMSNPTSCGEQVTTFTARSWAMSPSDPSVSGTASYTATGCQSQPYDPGAALTIDGMGGDLGPGARPRVTSLVTQSPGEANNERVVVTLPDGIGINGPKTELACTPEAFEAGTCSSEAEVGSATAVSPLLEAPLQGPVYLVESDVFPKIGLDLKGSLPLKIVGQSSIDSTGGGFRIVNVFEGLPDLPLSRFELTFPGGPDSLLTIPGDFCSTGATMNADFTSHAGQHVSRDIAPTLIGGCPLAGPPAAPRATAKVKGTAKGRPVTSIRIASPAPKVSGARIRLPKALRLAKGARRAIVVRADGERLPRAATAGSKGRALKLRRLPAGGAAALAVRIKPGALAKPQRVKRGKRLAFRIVVNRPGTPPARLTARARAR